MISHIPAAYQKADILTKPLTKQSFLRFKQELHVEDIMSLLKDADLMSTRGKLQNKGFSDLTSNRNGDVSTRESQSRNLLEAQPPDNQRAKTQGSKTSIQI